MNDLTKATKSGSALIAFGLLAVATAVVPGTAHAGKGGAFIGGLIGGHILTNMANQSERQTRAMEYQAYQQQQRQLQQQQQQQRAPAQQREPTVEERLETLERLAANGMITKEEYQKRRQAIIDGI